MTPKVKTVGVWLAVVALIAQAYAMTRHGDRTLLWVVGTAGVVVAIMVTISSLRAQKALEACREGTRLLAQGRIAGALERFVAATMLWDRPAFRFSAAVAQLHLFRLDLALDQLEKLAARAHPEPLRSSIAEHRTLARVLRGVASRSEIVGLSDSDALSLLAVACFETRDGQFAEAEAILGDPVIKQLGGGLRALSDTLAAWCALVLRGERRVIDRSALFHEADPEGLLQHWPALRTFLDQAP